MIDKIKGRLSELPISFNPNEENIEVTVKHHSSDTDSDKYNVDGIKFSINNNSSLTLNQSIGKALNGYQSKYYYENFIDDISKIKNNHNIGIDLMDLEIDNIELFWDIETKYEPINYTTLIQPHTVYQFNQITGYNYVYGDMKSSKSIYIKTDNWTVCFYDKGKESNKDGNILRYELRIIKPMDYFKITNKLLLSNLLEPKFFKDVIRGMYDKLLILNINKTQKLSIELDNLQGLTKSELIDYYTYLGVQSCGGYETEVNRLKGLKNLNSYNKCRAIRHLFGVYSDSIVFESSSLYSEMIEKFRQEKEKNIESVNSYYYNNSGIQQYLQSNNNKGE